MSTSTTPDTGSDLLGFGAGMLAGALLSAIFGLLVIWLNTNQYATGLALSLFGSGFSAFVGIAYTQARLMPDLLPLMQSEDAQEGVMSFIQRREAQFKGR